MLEEEEDSELESRIALAPPVSLAQPVVNSLRELERPPCYARVDRLWIVMAAMAVMAAMVAMAAMMAAVVAQVAQVAQVWWLQHEPTTSEKTAGTARVSLAPHAPPPLHAPAPCSMITPR